MKIILGSQSEGRAQVLSEMGYQFEVMAADIDEKAIRHADPKELVLALANAKADALLPKITEHTILITADQVVVWGNEIREKPENEEQERYFLKTYHEKPAEIVNGIVVTNTVTGKRSYALDASTIFFRKFSEDIIEKIVAMEHIYRRAGGFAIQDTFIKPYIEKVEGTDDSVIGLPKQLTERLIKEVQ